jgi:excisionase family DNA binding protein
MTTQTTRWLRTKAAAEYCGLTVAQMRQFAKDGVIGKHKIGRKTLLFDRNELDAWIGACREVSQHS